MKLFYVSLACTLAIAATTVGCGKSQDNPPNGQPGSVVTSGVAPIPAPVGAGTMPTGCYYNGGATCAPCPAGYMQSGSFCTLNGAANCGTGGTWNGYNCGQPNGFGCPASGTWSWQNGGCVTNNYGNYPGYQCSAYGYAYICYYTSGAPSSGYYYNGYGWMRF